MRVEGNTDATAGTIIRFAYSHLNIAFFKDIMLAEMFSNIRGVTLLQGTCSMLSCYA